MKSSSASSLSILAFILILGMGLVIAFALGGTSRGWPSYAVGGAALLLAAIVSSALKIANQWDRAVVLRTGRFQAGGVEDLHQQPRGMPSPGDEHALRGLEAEFDHRYRP